MDFLRIPSITRNRESVEKAAHWIINRLKRTTDSVELIKTVGNPAIIAEWLPQIKSKSNQKLPTILFYGHYDVQPPEPLELWKSPPFEPTIREGRIYARGVGDNKGQLYAHLCAVECLHQVKKLGLNVKFLFDGEEELGSPNLEEVLESKKQFFTDIDVVIVSDGPADLSWRPTIVFGVRGIVTAQLCLQSATNDVHSGNFGGIQPNPALDLLQILQTMINDQGKCLIEGFYKNVFDPDSLAIEAANQLDRTPNMYKEILGISYFGGEQDYPLIHRVMFRPTFNIRGFHSGAVREQAKTIIPKDAVVELDMRLVPHQKPKKIEKLVITHLERLKQQSSRWAAVIDRCEIKFEASFSPMYTSLDLPVCYSVCSARSGKSCSKRKSNA
jgi:acetylornithine deacetylase/succinyl-diaminopimelate desuccinylase-like protein